MNKARVLTNFKTPYKATIIKTVSVGQFSQSVHSLSRVRLFATPWISACQASLSITNSLSSCSYTDILFQTLLHYRFLHDIEYSSPLFKVSSVQFSHSVVSYSLQPLELQHARPPCPSPTPGVHSDSCPSSQWCNPAISSSVVPFSSCPQSLPALDSFPMSQFFTWGGQSTGVSALASFPPKKS